MPYRRHDSPSHRSSPTMGRSKSARLAYERMMTHARDLEFEGDGPYLHLQEVVPEAWDTLEHDVDVMEDRIKITLRLDASVVKFYRAMGPGYQSRINRVLATFAQMRIAGVRRAEERLERFRAEDAG